MKPHFTWPLVFGGLSLFAFTSAAGNWPQFRGPSGQGISAETSLPVRWSETENVAWKTPIPGDSWSSPIVWENRVFVTTATEDGVSCRLLCLETATGLVLWNKEVLRQSTAGRKEGRNTFATPTPATDGHLVYTAYFDGSFAAVDFSGNVVWTNRSYPFYSQHGLGTSPILWHDLLIMARDGSSPGDNKKLGWQEPWDKSFIVALDKESGKERWKASRGLSRIGHSVPVAWTNGAGKAMLLSGAGDVVQCYDPTTGARLWSSLNKGEGLVPSPAVGDDLVFAACGFSGRESIKAFRIAGEGELHETNLVWEVRKAMPKVPSLLYMRPHLYTVSDIGQVMCIQAETGEVVWQEKLAGNFGASPVYANGRLYFLSDAGETTVIEASPQFKIVAKNALNEKCQASMAVSNRRLLIRTERNLVSIH